MYSKYSFDCLLLLLNTHFLLKGNGFESDVSLDDISFAQGGTCAYFASTTQAPTTPQTAAYECDFEDNTTCNWQIESQDKPWIISSGDTAIYGKAPLTDSTKQNTLGKYAYVPIDSTGGPTYHSILSFRGLPNGAPFCLDFWYQSFISSNTSLNVYLQSGSSPVNNLWRRPGTTLRDQWTHGSVNLGTIHGTTRVSIEGKI